FAYGVVLVIFVAPQVVLYTLAALGAAVQQAQGRFALAAAAPAAENIVLIITCGLAAVLYGTGHEVDDVPIAMVLLLGSGATAAVTIHAVLQMAGARRAGLPLRPMWGWRNDAATRDVARALRRSIRVAAFPSIATLAFIAAAATVRGGVIVFQAALAVYNVT